MPCIQYPPLRKEHRKYSKIKLEIKIDVGQWLDPDATHQRLILSEYRFRYATLHAQSCHRIP